MVYRGRFNYGHLFVLTLMLVLHLCFMYHFFFYLFFLLVHCLPEVIFPVSIMEHLLNKASFLSFLKSVQRISIFLNSEELAVLTFLFFLIGFRLKNGKAYLVRLDHPLV